MQSTLSIKDQLNACLREREQVADILQNEVSQVLAAALLRIQCIKNDYTSPQGTTLQQPETYLKAAIDKIRSLHYSLAADTFNF